MPQPGPDRETLVLRGLPVAEGGFILLLNGIATWEPAPAPAASLEIDEPNPPPEMTTRKTHAPIEW